VKLRLIGCEVLFRELCAAAARSPHQVDVAFLPKGLHDLGGKRMAREIQEQVDQTEPGVYDAIVLGYGLCGNGLDGITARQTPLVLPRTHDCIALLMGGRERYLKYFNEHPGTYYRSTGWLERGKGLQQLTHGTTGMEESLEAMIARYGEDNGRYLYQELTSYRSNYQRLTFITTGLEADTRFEDEARAEATEHGWDFERLEGDLRLPRALVEGHWNADDFLVAQPGERFSACYDERIMIVVPAES
jgi:hypothetical protein